MPRIIGADRARLEYEVSPATTESTCTFVFQHGMGGNRRQPLGYLPSHAHADIVAMDARGHGDSTDLIGEGRQQFNVFADDVVALLDHLGVERAVVGGISLGAAVALNVTIRYPERVRGLVLCRPAWLDKPQDELNSSAYAYIADLLDHHGGEEALPTLEKHPAYREIRERSAAAGQSLRHQITRPRAAVNADMLRQLPASTPVADSDEWKGITVPTLVIGHTDDPLHRWDIAVRTSELIAGASLVRVPSKDDDADAFQAQISRVASAFLDEFAGVL